MRKRYIILLSLIILTSILVLWIVEPFSINPMKDKPISLAKSKMDQVGESNEGDLNLLKIKADSILDNAILMNDFLGVSAGVYKSDIGSWIGSAGFASKRDQKVVNNKTLFRTASIAKPLTAIAIMQLYQQDLLALDQPIQTYLPEFPKKSKGDITIRQLLNHTSGIKHYSSDLAVLSFKHYDSCIHALDKFKEESLRFTPGTGYEYSSYGYTVLGAIIETVTGGSYEAYMKENILLPAGMTNTSVEDASRDYVNKANLYIKLGSNYIKSPKTDLSVKYPGGGFHTTADDFLKFGKAILDNTLIDRSSLELMMGNSSSLKQGTPYGFGWFIIEHDKLGRILKHGGSQSGASSDFQILLDKGIVTISLANNFGSDAGVQLLVRDLTKLVHDEKQIDRPVAYFRDQSDGLLNELVGTYKYDKYQFEITNDDGQLYSQLNEYPAVPLYPRSASAFFMRPFGKELNFSRNNDGNSTLNYIDDGDTIVCVRKG